MQAIAAPGVRDLIVVLEEADECAGRQIQRRRSAPSLLPALVRSGWLCLLS